MLTDQEGCWRLWHDVGAGSQYASWLLVQPWPEKKVLPRAHLVRVSLRLVSYDLDDMADADSRSGQVWTCWNDFIVMKGGSSARMNVGKAGDVFVLQSMLPRRKKN